MGSGWVWRASAADNQLYRRRAAARESPAIIKSITRAGQRRIHPVFEGAFPAFATPAEDGASAAAIYTCTVFLEREEAAGFAEPLFLILTCRCGA